MQAAQPTTFLGPTVKGSYTFPIDNITALSFAGEAGIKNFRLSTTAGWFLSNDQRTKLSAEYLWQNLAYSFSAGHVNKWVDQIAVGGSYQYDLRGYRLNPQFDFNAYVSHAPSHDLGTKQVIINGILLNDIERIAGSNAFGASPGISFQPWDSGITTFYLNYDDVRYNKKFLRSRDEIGFGGTFLLEQAITDNIGLDITAGIRKPFNTYGANLNWNNFNYYGIWSFGLDGEYTNGKNTLPNSWNVGASADYTLDCPQTMAAHQVDYKNEMAYGYCESREVCLDTAHPYVMVVNANTPPVFLNYSPPELGQKLPIITANSGFNAIK